MDISELIENARLLGVTYGPEIGLLSLQTGTLLATTYGDASALLIPADVPSLTITGDAAEELFGEEHSWDDLIEHLRENYDWEDRNLPDVPAATYEVIRFYNDGRTNETVRTGLTLSQARDHCNLRSTQVPGVSFDGYTRE